MSIEHQSPKCPSCKAPLTWMSHTTLWDQGSEVHEFAFSCNSCNHDYVFKGDKIIENNHRESYNHGGATSANH